jgi:hypothetical protein
VFSRDVPSAVPDRPLEGREFPPKRRIVVRDYVRLEQRDLFYSGDKPTSPRSPSQSP